MVVIVLVMRGADLRQCQRDSEPCKPTQLTTSDLVMVVMAVLAKVCEPTQQQCEQMWCLVILIST